MRYLATIVLLSLAACAQNPDNIAAVDIGPNPYLAFSCTELAQEELALTQALADLSAQQRRAASGDAVGVFLLGLPISSMAGGDQETQIAVTRGRLNALGQSRASHHC